MSQQPSLHFWDNHCLHYLLYWCRNSYQKSRKQTNKHQAYVLRIGYTLLYYTSRASWVCAPELDLEQRQKTPYIDCLVRDSAFAECRSRNSQACFFAKQDLNQLKVISTCTVYFQVTKVIKWNYYHIKTIPSALHAYMMLPRLSCPWAAPALW